MSELSARENLDILYRLPIVGKLMLKYIWFRAQANAIYENIFNIDVRRRELLDDIKLGSKLGIDCTKQGQEFLKTIKRRKHFVGMMESLRQEAALRNFNTKEIDALLNEAARRRSRLS